MSRAVIVVNGNYDRDRASQWAKSAPSGCIIEFRQSKRTLDQNARLWACLTEIARKVEWHGMKLPADDWKEIFTAALRKHRFVPGLDANTIVPLGMRTSDMTKQEFSDLLELINAFAAEHGVEFQDHQSSDTPSPSDEGSDGEASPGQGTVVADLSDTGDGVDEGAGDIEAREEPGASPAPAYTRADCIKAFMRTATDAALSVAERRELLAESKNWWKDALSADLDFVKACLATADKVAKGELQEAAARSYLDAIPAPKGGA